MTCNLHSWALIRVKRRRRHGSGEAHFLRDPALGHGSLGELLGCHPTLGAASGAVQQRTLQHRGSPLADCPSSAHSAQGEHPRHGGVSACLRGGSTQKYSLSTVTGRAHWQLSVLLQWRMCPMSVSQFSWLNYARITVVTCVAYPLRLIVGENYLTLHVQCTDSLVPRLISSFRVREKEPGYEASIQRCPYH